LAQQSSQAIDDIEALNLEAGRLSRDGRLAEAVPIAQRVLALAEARFEPNDPNVATALNNLAYMHFAQHSAEAVPLYLRLISIYDSAPDRQGEAEVWDALVKLDTLYRAQGRMADADPFAARARAIERNIARTFEVPIPSQEIITTDLKRLRLTDCGIVSFQVDHPRELLMSFASVERAQRFAMTEIPAAHRAVLGSKSLAEIREQSDSIGREIKEWLDRWGQHAGVSAREVNADFRLCAIHIQ
jgi:tetratricopeptide (TPR) repeat protein